MNSSWKHYTTFRFIGRDGDGNLLFEGYWPPYPGHKMHQIFHVNPGWFWSGVST